MSTRRFFLTILFVIFAEVLFLALVTIVATPTHAQALPAAKAPATTVLVDGAIGGGFGAVPFVEIGGGIERHLGRYFEVQGQFEYTPALGNALGPAKAGSAENVNLLYWVKPRFAVYGAYRASQEYLEGISKAPTYFDAGLVLRDRWNADMPGRIYLAYEEEIGGCVWATPTNPCQITASRLRGGSVTQEFRISSHFRLGFIVGVYSVGQQVNPNDRTAYLRTFATEGLARFRYTLGKQSTDLY